jgi:hypothetical protein
LVTKNSAEVLTLGWSFNLKCRFAN